MGCLELRLTFEGCVGIWPSGRFRWAGHGGRGRGLKSGILDLPRRKRERLESERCDPLVPLRG